LEADFALWVFELICSVSRRVFGAAAWLAAFATTPAVGFDVTAAPAPEALLAVSTTRIVDPTSLAPGV